MRPSCGQAVLLPCWRIIGKHWASPLGKEVHVLGREPFFAEALDITPEGELLVRRADNGKEEVVFSGEVSIRGVI